MVSSNVLENLRTLKKVLKTPQKFRQTEYQKKACFSYNYKQWGYLETWELAWGKLRDLPPQENVFHELILSDTKVKPYLDVEWYQEKFPDYYPDQILMTIKQKLVEIFLEDWGVALKNNEMYIASCHRKKTEGYKYSFRIVVSTHEPYCIAFQNTNCASFLAKRVRSEISSCGIDKEIVDISPYSKTQNLRFVGHSKAGEYIPMQKMNVGDDDFEFIVTNVSPVNVILPVPEQEDNAYKNIANIEIIDDKILETIVEKVKEVHPTAVFESMDTNGFMQFNYKDRSEPCFCHTDKVLHERVGFFCYVYDNLILIGCHSGNCVKENNNKIIKSLGSLKTQEKTSYEKVDFDNDNFQIDHKFVETCIHDGSYGMSNLFQKMYLEPKRIKWTNEGKNGTSYFWDGSLWKEDDHSFLDRLVASNIVKVLRNYAIKYLKNPDIYEDEDKSVMECNSMIKKLNDGHNIHSILKFLKPLINDHDFTKVKDIHPYLLSCKNGVVDLKSGTLRDCLPSDNMTKRLDIAYNSDANSTDFDCFVKQITSSETGEDIELYNYLKWSFGYAMQGSPVKKMFFILYGEKGYNGKSMILNTVKNVLSYYSVAMDKSVIVSAPSKTGGSHSSELCQLENVRLGILSETKEDEVINDAQIKMLTGVTDRISVREIYGKQKEILPTLVAFISSNHKLKINLKDSAMYERLALIPFRLSFLDNPDPSKPWQRKGDNNLAEKFDKNKEGILKWLVEASVYYHENPYLKPPEIAMEAKREYKKEMDDYANFVSNYFEITDNKNDKIKVAEVFQKYKQYHEEYIRPCTGKGYDKKKTEKIINDYFGVPVKNNYINVKFREDLDDDSDVE